MIFMDEEKWSELEEEFKNHFGEVEKTENELVFDSGSSKFMVSAEGTVKASMPLHSFIAENFQRLEFKDNHVRVLCRDVIYEFRK